MARIMVIDDDEGIRSSLHLLLTREGFDVSAHASAEDALTDFERLGVDLCLVDIMLPGMSGLEATRRLRQRSDIPILVISARDDTRDVVAGLEAGADDYVTKPFAAPELLARMKAHLRRRPDQVAPEFRVGSLKVSPAEGVVLDVNGAEVHLTATEFRLLVELARSDGRVLSREDLLERVWHYDYFGDTRLVDVHVRRLRVKIEADPAVPEHLLTVRGLGYKLVF